MQLEGEGGVTVLSDKVLRRDSWKYDGILTCDLQITGFALYH